MAKLWPLPSSTMVSARRTVSAGTVMLELPAVSLTAPTSLSWLTSGATLRLMRPSDSTVGVNSRFTPNFLKVTVIWPFCWPTGMGNSPPARKLADWPLMTVRFGSASTWARLSCASASIRPLKPTPWQPTVTQARAEVVLAAKDSAGTLPMLPIEPSACQLMPSWRVTVRDISG